MKSTVIDRVLELYRRWGVRCTFEAPPERPRIGLWSGPRFNMAIDTDGGLVHLNSRVPIEGPYDTHDFAHAALHELSHVLIGGRPTDHDENDGPTLALDFAHGRLVRAESWTDWMHDFVAFKADGTECEWQKLSTRRRGEILRESRHHAERAGLLDSRGRPTWRRTFARTDAL